MALKAPTKGLLLASINDVYRYGLPFSTNQDKTCVMGLMERGFAKYYLLDYERTTAAPYSKRKEIKEREWEAQALLLGRLVMDYITQTCLGEARHWKGCTPDVHSCNRCAPFKTPWEGGREGASSKYMEVFQTYAEAHDALNHIFWDHAWKKGMGGWKWGNIAWAAHNLRLGFENKDINHLAKWLDMVAAITHNGASCLYSKYGWYYFNYQVMNSILWAKFHAQPCCIEYLKRASETFYDFIPHDVGCIHLNKGTTRDSWDVQSQPILRYGYEKRHMCERCREVKAIRFMDGNKSICYNYCKGCSTCKCKFINKMCTKCGEVHQEHGCKGLCGICGPKYPGIKFNQPHPICHYCEDAGSWYKSTTDKPHEYSQMALLDDNKVELKRCACGSYQYVTLEPGKSLHIIKKGAM